MSLYDTKDQTLSLNCVLEAFSAIYFMTPAGWKWEKNETWKVKTKPFILSHSDRGPIGFVLASAESVGNSWRRPIGLKKQRLG